MSTPAWTKGPWNICWTLYDGKPVGFEVTASPKGSTRPLLECKGWDAWKGDEQELAANALLVSAAPDLLAVAKAYEAWEADVILNGDWSNATVRLTQAQHDALIEIQTLRNAALRKAGGEASE